MEFHERLRAEIDKLPMSHTQFGMQCGIGRHHLSHILMGDKKPAFDTLVALLNELPKTVNIKYILLGKKK